MNNRTNNRTNTNMNNNMNYNMNYNMNNIMNNIMNTNMSSTGGTLKRNGGRGRPDRGTRSPAGLDRPTHGPPS